ncbi:ATP-dependent DNA helicase RecQ [Imhoffiella purpurea]|uniref:ATP-dependent DNA helicase RecQ n=1 Tax=Imhoffiella purpurea TaxID=1249627 RepID=W9VUC9_9GAMM|nr:ATP-dependent DNA helicase RecQ [Imhoffiella purpurea]
MDARFKDLLDRCLFLDLETGPGGDIHKIGAVHGDRSFMRDPGRSIATIAFRDILRLTA